MEREAFRNVMDDEASLNIAVRTCCNPTRIGAFWQPLWAPEYHEDVLD